MRTKKHPLLRGGKFILAQYKNVAYLHEHFSKMLKDKDEIEDEFDWFLCVESYKKSRCKVIICLSL